VTDLFAAAATDRVSADPDRLDGFAASGRHQRLPLAADLDELVATRGRVVDGCGDRSVVTDGVERFRRLLHAMADNEGFAAAVADALRRVPRSVPVAVPLRLLDGPVELVDAHLEVLGVGEAPPLIEAGPVEFHGLPPMSGFVDDPVCAANGNFVHGDHDLAFPGFASVIDVVRFYNSRGGRRPGRFGRGWSSLLDMGVEGDRVAGLVRVRLGDGAAVPFVRTGGDGWRLSGRRRLTLDETADGWLLRDGSPGRGAGRTWSFDRAGRLRGGAVRGARFLVERAPGRLTVRELTTGRSIDHHLDDRGLVVESVASDGRRVRYRHDADGHCLAVERPRGDLRYRVVDGLLAAVDDADGVTQFHNAYDEGGRVAVQVGPDGRISRFRYRDRGGLRVVDERTGVVNAFVHDGRGNLTSVTDGAGHTMRIRYDRLDRPVTITDRAGATTRYRYDDRASVDQLVERVDADGGRERWVYDALGRLVATIDRSGRRTGFHYPTHDADHSAAHWADHWADHSADHWAAPLPDGSPDRPAAHLPGPGTPRPGPTRIDLPGGGQVRVTYDGRGLATRVVDADGVATHLTWDRDGELAAVVDGAGRRTHYLRDRLGRLVGVVGPDGSAARFAIDGRGRVRSVTHPDGTIDHHTTSRAGRPLRCVSDGPRSWSARYGPTGRPIEFTDGGGARVGLAWSDEGRLVGVVAPDGATHRYEYSSTGDLVAAIDPAGNVTGQEHDPEGRVVAVTLPGGRRAARTVDALGRTRTVTGFDGSTFEVAYHPDGPVAQVVDGRGGRFRAEVDAAGRVVAEIDPAGGRTSLRWSTAGRLLEVTTPAGRRWRARRDGSGRLVAVVDPDGRTGPAGPPFEPRREDGSPRATGDRLAGRAGVRVDGRGLIEAVVDPAGVATRISRDLRGRVVATTTGPVTTAVGYDPAGRVVASADATGRLQRIGVSPDGRVVEVLPGGLLGARYDLDGGGRPIGASGPSGGPLVEWLWGPDGRLDGGCNGLGRWHLGRDPLGRLVSVANPFGVTTVERDGDGVVTATADRLGRVERVRTPGGGLLAFSVDPTPGRAMPAGSPAPPCSAGPRGSSDSSVSSVLPVPVDRPAPTTDRFGRVTVDRHGRTHRYDAAGRLVATVAADGRAWHFEWDRLGRLVGERTPAGQRRYDHDLASRPIEVVETTGRERRRTTFGFDQAGRRIVERRSDGRVVRYRWNAIDQLIGVTTVEADGRSRHRRIDHDPLGRPVLVDGEIVVSWDDAVTGKVVGIGEVRVLRAGADTLVLAPGHDWSDGTVDDPWGHEPGRPSGVRIGYRGELEIDGLVFLGARVYDPSTRSFLSPDPRPPVAGRIAFASSYGYAWCDPVNHVDPTGERPIDLATYREIREREEGSRFGRAWQAITDDPWASMAVVGLVVVGGALCLTPLAPVGAGILVGFATGALRGLATDSFDPRMVAVSAAVGGVGGGGAMALTAAGAGAAAGLGFGAATGGAESLAMQVIVDGSAWGEIDWGRVAIDGLIGVVGAGAADRIGAGLRARSSPSPPAGTAARSAAGEAVDGIAAVGRPAVGAPRPWSIGEVGRGPAGTGPRVPRLPVVDPGSAGDVAATGPTP
jgi:RHS repeat-associated protein